MWRDIATQLFVAVRLPLAPPVGGLVARLVWQQLAERRRRTPAPTLLRFARRRHADQRTSAALTAAPCRPWARLYYKRFCSFRPVIAAGVSSMRTSRSPGAHGCGPRGPRSTSSADTSAVRPFTRTLQPCWVI